MPIVFWQIRLLFWNLPITCVTIGAHSYESDTSLVLWYYLIMPIIKHLSVVIVRVFNVLVEWISHQSHFRRHLLAMGSWRSLDSTRMNLFTKTVSQPREISHGVCMYLNPREEPTVTQLIKWLSNLQPWTVAITRVWFWEIDFNRIVLIKVSTILPSSKLSNIHATYTSYHVLIIGEDWHGNISNLNAQRQQRRFQTNWKEYRRTLSLLLLNNWFYSDVTAVYTHILVRVPWFLKDFSQVIHYKPFDTETRELKPVNRLKLSKLEEARPTHFTQMYSQALSFNRIEKSVIKYS